MLNAYSSIYNLGHRATNGLLDQEVVVQEKVDGSQFTFGLKEGKLSMRSKGVEVFSDSPGMFKLAAETCNVIQELLVPGWIYRGEFLSKPKHNSLAYSRTPINNIILFDIEKQAGSDEFMTPDRLAQEAEYLGLESVPVLYQGIGTGLDVRGLLATASILGGQLIEGVVIKQLSPTIIGADKKAVIAKYVSDSFKEVHKHAWKDSNPSGKDFIGNLADTFKTETRWRKAVQHLREAGVLQYEMSDIGKLMKEVPVDILKDFEQEIKDKLFKHAWPIISRRSVNGLAEWYKNELNPVPQTELE